MSVDDYFRICGVGLASAQREQRDLGWAIKPERYADGADSTIDVELKASEPEPPLNVPSTQLRQGHSAHQRQANLTSMRVAAQHQSDGLSRRKLQ